MFFLLLVVYSITISMNLLIITLVSTSKNLHTPMYFFLTQLFLDDIFLTTDIAPNTLHILLNKGGAITFIDCITQLYFFGASEASECLILTVMSYDRYVAICNPLHYCSIMTSPYCVILATISWLGGFFIMMIIVITTSLLSFCGPNIIDHFFCDLLPLLELSCSDTYNLQMEITIIIITLVITPLILIITSYSCIISSILKIQSLTRRRKVFSTCSSHLTVVCIFYGTICGIYIVPTKGKGFSMSTAFSLFYTVVTPVLNPIVYSLRNKELNIAIKTSIQQLSLSSEN
ncbi:Olfactory receptor, partial [Pristimantis euphronides]